MRNIKVAAAIIGSAFTLTSCTEQKEDSSFEVTDSQVIDDKSLLEQVEDDILIMEVEARIAAGEKSLT
uniref:hypothetical protein n=1 Tax=uncultured Erythrobacter sp. TaxID=263913 RepID=UPI0026191D6E|nr:hypothetical protein [uncultured Erythrobacter sp.]